MSPARRTGLRFLAVFVILGGIGLLATVYLLIEERAPLPFSNTYLVRARFAASDGVVSGLGQPVNVVGVKVGQVTGAEVVDGTAVVTLEIQRSKLAHVYGNATAALRPITPLNDMQVDLDPGGPPSAPLAAGATLALGQTSAPVPLSDLLSTLDGDTRAFLSSLIASLGQGFGGRGADLQRMLAAMGPTVNQADEVTRALATRRAAIARLVHNLAIVTGAASRDGQLASLVTAGDQTLQSLTDEDVPLRAALAQLPPTLATASRTLTDLEPFAGRLGPTVGALLPSVRRLPATLDALRPFVDQGTTTLRDQLRPLVTAAQPLVSELAPTLPPLASLTPRLSQAFQILKYTTNELAYNPGGKDQGFLFWTAWAFHNFNSVISVGDAHGGIGRAQVLLNCYGAQNLPAVQRTLGVLGLCPQ
jgi:phospholipid/cholesterol/gamma-HCH transport system substrate-binding protein